MNEDAVIYRIIKEYVCKNSWMLIGLLSLQVKFMIESKIKDEGEILQEFTLTERNQVRD